MVPYILVLEKMCPGDTVPKTGTPWPLGCGMTNLGPRPGRGGLETDPPLPLHPGWVGPGTFYGLIGAKNVAVRNVLFCLQCYFSSRCCRDPERGFEPR